MTKNTNPQLHVRVPQELREILRFTAYTYGVSMNDIIRAALTNAFFRYAAGEKQINYESMARYVDNKIKDMEAEQ